MGMHVTVEGIQGRILISVGLFNVAQLPPLPPKKKPKFLRMEKFCTCTGISSCSRCKKKS